MDEMQDYEIQTLSGMLEYVDYDEWRRMRLLYHGIVSPYLKNKNTTPDKLIPLPGDEELEEKQIEMTNEERDILRNRSKALQEKLFKKKNTQ